MGRRLKVYSLHKSQVVPRPLQEIFSFFNNPANLPELTPPAMGFKILTPTPIAMANGTVIDYSVRVLGFPLRWTSLISEYDPPNSFVDIQTRGPYAYWHHRHIFKAHPQGTEIEDIVDYSLPGGFLGRLAHAPLVAPQLEKIFSYRNEVLTEILGETV